jgi:predicted O-methyltransferase YrrM
MIARYAGAVDNFMTRAIAHNASTRTTTATALLEEILHSGHVQTEDGQSVEVHSQFPHEAGRMLQQIIREIDARHTLEVGLAFGISALFICEAIADKPGARHIAIDPSQHGRAWLGIGLRHLRQCGLDHLLDFREMFSHQALSDLEREGVKVDFALIDGFHTFDYVMMDALLVDRLLRVGGVMAMDDTEWPSVRKACRYLITNRGYRVMRCWGGQAHENLAAMRKVISAAARRSPGIAARIKPEWAQRDEDLGLAQGCRCVALVKTKDDDRVCFEHEPF